MGPKLGWLWPTEVPADLRLSTLVSMLAKYGFERCFTGELDPTLSKIALYGGGEHVTHAARQLESGRWTSKRGIFGDDIEHDTADAIAGGEYFEILAYFQRPKTDPAT